MNTSANALTSNKKLSDCTLGELASFINAVMKGKVKPAKEKQVEKIIIDGKQYYKGISGIQEVFKVGRNKALEYKNSDWIKEAILQQGRQIFVNKELALQLFNRRFNLAGNHDECTE